MELEGCDDKQHVGGEEEGLWQGEQEVGLRRVITDGPKAQFMES